MASAVKWEEFFYEVSQKQSICNTVEITTLLKDKSKTSYWFIFAPAMRRFHPFLFNNLPDANLNKPDSDSLCPFKVFFSVVLDHTKAWKKDT